MPVSLSQTNHYQRARIETASQKQLILMAYDRILLDMEEARAAFETSRLEDANHALQHAQQVVGVLREALDTRQPQVEMLLNFYLFLKRRLIQANVQASPEILAQLLPAVKEIRDAWETGFATQAANRSNTSVAAARRSQVTERRPLSIEL